ncbi:S-layer homology domain-containing protein [Virgibacillus halodenitrificans]|uniref:S-layer homology domain-containing protein n=1 Tax=Virgibacillus halodenitrificans TaxID=1482 RepID=UPI000EF4FAA7|nr:S-layer homology domain-containing protein [Virgibacillus halodenitrificans]
MKKKWLFILVGFILGLGLIMPSQSDTASAKAKPTYTVSTNSKTYKGNMMNYSTYNKYTKHYYLLRSYLERLEKTGGGTLVLKKGTYTISNTLYVPSNVTIKLQDGVKLVKGTKTGTSKFSAAKSMFQFVRPSLAKNTGVYGKYSGEKNIKVIGSGSATIDLNYVHKSLAIIAGHNQNITIKNIHFKNMYSGHFIEMDATKGATISNNTFKSSKASKNRNKEAINLDTPDKETNGWSQKWSTFDKTPNANITIANNTFKNLDRAIGTHKYSGGKYHDKVVIRSNTIDTMREDPIRVMNWSNAVIENNTIRNVGSGPDNYRRGILVSGAHNPTFKNNTFISTPRAMQFMVWKNSGPGSNYAITYNKLSKSNIQALKTNTVIDYKEDFIRINKVYGKYDKANTDFIDVQSSRFYDLRQNDSGYEQTIHLVNQGIINGYADFSFKPYRSISRQHVAVMLTNALKLDIPNNVSNTLSVYKDVDEDHYYAKQIAAVTAEGIFKGGSGKFNPDQDITRSQMATVLVGALNLQQKNTAVDLTDLERIDLSHRHNVEILAQNEITVGKTDKNGDRYFDGNGALKRIQFAIFLDKAMQIE